MILRGQYTFHIRDLHTRYGPIVRINPYELHISDPNFYDTLYASSASGEKRDKWEWYTKQFGTPGAMFSTTGHDQHKARRGALNRFFSMASVRRLQPVIEERVDTLVERLRGFKDVEGSEGVIKIDYAYAAFTNGQFFLPEILLRCTHQVSESSQTAADGSSEGRFCNFVQGLPSYFCFLDLHFHSPGLVAAIYSASR